MAKTVFYSFHYERDVHRAQLVKNIGALEGQPLLNSQQWEEVRRGGTAGIERWIDKEMKYKRVVIVLIGQETASREWVRYEIEKAWEEKRPLLGVQIHGLSSMGTADRPGVSPFNPDSGIPVFDPTRTDAYGRIDTRATYNSLNQNLEGWSSQGKVRPR